MILTIREDFMSGYHKENNEQLIKNSFAYCAEQFGVSIDEVKEDIKELFDSMRFSENAQTRDRINCVLGESNEERSAEDMVEQLFNFLDRANVEKQ